MNLFFTSRCPIQAAIDHCDVHTRKMIVETAQMLSTAHRVLDGQMHVVKSPKGRNKKIYILSDDRESVLYSATHINHPSAKWIRESKAHYDWAYKLFANLIEQYRIHTGKCHKSSSLLSILKSSPTNIPDLGWVCDPHIAINFNDYPALKEFESNSDHTIIYREYMKAKLSEWTDRKFKFGWYTQAPSWMYS